MFSLDTLNTVIAIVVVLLVLSLLVQAIQSFIKKIFKLKSKDIEKSLSQLCEHVMDTPADDATPALSSPPASALASPTASAPASQPIDAQQLTTKVMEEFKSIGRQTRWGGVVLDSISKEDLLKILAKIDSRHFYADYTRKFQDMYTDIQALEREINRLVTNDPPLLQGAASARFAEMQQVLTPLINDVKNIAAGNTIRSDVVFGDLINLRQVKLDEALKLLAAAQDSITADIKAEREAKNDLTVAALQQLSASLTKIAGILGQLSLRMDAAFTSLRTKLDQVERWYDTVMQSFEERYTRNMKTVALWISIAVVVYLNASFFRVYHNIASSDIHRALIVQEGENLVDDNQPRPANRNTNRTGNANSSSIPATTNAGSASNANANTSANLNVNANAQSNSNTSGNLNSANANTSVVPANANTATNSQPSAQTSNKTTDNQALDELDEERKVIDDYVDTYESFGFSPLTWQEVKIWFKGLFGSEVLRDDNGTLINKYGDPVLTNCEPTNGQDCKQASISPEGVPLNKNGDPIPTDCKPVKPQDCQPVYRPLASGEWWADRKQDFTTLIGWAVMVLLLSVGAPFWQDTLESLFGVKNLLRKRSDTKNVEKESGAGQPRS